MEIRTDDGDQSQVRIKEFDAFWIGVGGKCVGDRKTPVGGGGADLGDDDARAEKRLGAPPLDCDPGGERDVVPLGSCRAAGGGRQW